MNIKDEHNDYEAMMEKEYEAREAMGSDETEICTICNGSGEGMTDGTECNACAGSGEVAAW